MKKPVILLGAGCKGNPYLVNKLCSLGVPILTTWQGIDLVPEDCPSFCGRPGVIGQRAANIIQQKSNELYIFGARLDMEQVGWNMKNFGPRARKHVWDVDGAELKKLPADWDKHLEDLSRFDGDALFPIVSTIQKDGDWMAWCRDLYDSFGLELEGDAGNAEFVDPYYFVRLLSEAMPEGGILVPGSSGMQSCALMQAFKVKGGQRILLCNTAGSMGMESMAIGAAMATGQRVVVVTGDGGFALNMQELEIVRRENLPIVYFVFSNGGYGSVVSMQDQRFGRRVGADPTSGFTVPPLSKIADMFDFPYLHIPSSLVLTMAKDIYDIFRTHGPAIYEIHSSLEFKYANKMGSRMVGNQFILDGMEDMTPKIDNLREIMEYEE